MSNEMMKANATINTAEYIARVFIDADKKNKKKIQRLINENKNLRAKLEAKSNQKNNQRLWEESHKPVPRFVINDSDGYVTVREVIDSANGEVELSKEKFSYSDLKSLAVDKTVEWKHKKQNSEAKDFVKSFASSFATSFLMSYGISSLIKGLSKKR